MMDRAQLRYNALCLAAAKLPSNAKAEDVVAYATHLLDFMASEPVVRPDLSRERFDAHGINWTA